MTSVDKAAIAWSIAIVAVGAGFAGFGISGDMQPTTPPMMVEEKPAMKEQKPMAEPAAEEMTMMKQEEREAAMKEQKSMIMEEKLTMKEKAAMEEKAAMKQEKMMEEKPAMGPKTVNVSMPAGTSVPGCEETNECYIPASVSIKAGGTVTWTNDDTAAHTVTSGTAAGGPDGLFDSSLLMGGKTFSHTFDKAGSYDYFCLVHPWMTGNVKVG